MVSEQSDAPVGLGVPRIQVQRILGEFACRAGVVCVDVVDLDMGERGVHVGVERQVVGVRIIPVERGGFVEVVYGALVIGDLRPVDAAPSETLGVLGLYTIISVRSSMVPM